MASAKDAQKRDVDACSKSGRKVVQVNARVEPHPCKSSLRASSNCNTPHVAYMPIAVHYKSTLMRTDCVQGLFVLVLSMQACKRAVGRY